MLKKRIIPIQLLKNGRLVKSQLFKNFRDVGCPMNSSKVYNDQYADELIFLNINNDNSGITPLLDILEKVSSVCFMPLSLGGGISTFNDAKLLFENGADKIVLNSICYQNPTLITKISEHFGQQSIIACIDVKKEKDSYQLFSKNGVKREESRLKEHIKMLENQGVGEIMIQSINQDGSMKGFDIPLVQSVNKLTNLPVIAAGGAGNYVHLKDCYQKTNVSALACGSIFNFSDSNLIRAKAFLTNYDILFKKV